jgi:hypothetical protein
MAFSNLTRIILYVVAGISVILILFFYAGPKTIDYDALDQRVTEAQSPADLTPVAPLPQADTVASDSTSAEAVVPGQDTTVIMANQGASATPQVTESPEVNLREIMSGWEYLIWYRTDIILIWAYILIFLTLVASIVFPLIQVFSNPKALIRLVGVLAGAAVLLVVSYLLSSGTPLEIIGYTGTDNSNPAILKMIDTILFVTYMLFGLALVSILYAVISRPFK